MKLKYIIPALSIASSTAILAPFTISCGEETEFELKKYDERHYISKEFDFKIGQIYTFTLHVEDQLVSNGSDWEFNFRNLEEFPGVVNEESIWIKLNDRVLVYGKENDYYLNTNSNDPDFAIHGTNNSIITYGDRVVIKCALSYKFADKLYAGIKISSITSSN